MAAIPTSNPAGNPPSTKDCIMSMRNHDELFEMIAKYPQAGIHERYSKECQWAMAHREKEVNRCRRSLQLFLEENSKVGKIPQEDEYARLMESLTDDILRYGMYPTIVAFHQRLTRSKDRVVQATKRLYSAPPPSKLYMGWYRLYSHVDSPNMRAANGEMASMYGQDGDPLPARFAALVDDGLVPVTQFVLDWVINPLNDLIVERSRKHLRRFRTYRRRNRTVKNDGEAVEPNDDIGNNKVEENDGVVSLKTLSNISQAFVYVLAILLLIAPIATFNSIEKQTKRIAIMPFFCLLLVASAGRMGHNTMPVFMMVIA